MSYFVIGGDGQRYGPEEIPTLVQWAREGRLVGDSVLIDERTGRECRAGDLAELTAVLPRVTPRTFNVPDASPVVAMASLVRETPGSRSKVAAGLLGILFGSLGLHRFYMGFTGLGLLQLLLTVGTCGLGGYLTVPWGFIEGILCFTGHLRDVDGRPLRD